jgi:hypothetical protein
MTAIVTQGSHGQVNGNKLRPQASLHHLTNLELYTVSVPSFLVHYGNV